MSKCCYGRCKGRNTPGCYDQEQADKFRATRLNAPGVTEEMVEAALNAWFSGPQSESDQGLERGMKAAIEAAPALLTQPQEKP